MTLAEEVAASIQMPPRLASCMEIAEAWETTQSNVSRFEHAQDTYLSTLMRCAAALGEWLELKVVLPDQVVDLTPGETKLVVAREK